ncbi:TatD family hydrolase [Shewanella sp. 202IG2-18]|nr:TatD family hydrolase [Parashewanella hymeniacidonis]MBM7071672.1 TatD family hydrolase [Parashewanella hymeniacidonis]
MIDSHAHIDFADFDGDRDAIFEQMQLSGISNVLIPGVSSAHWQKQLSIAKKYQSLFALGVHPWYVTETFENDIVELKKLINQHLENDFMVAIGECGLDKIKSANWVQQISAFEAQLQLAEEYQMPMIVHSVRAHGEVLTLLEKYKLPKGGIIHGFYGSVEVAKQYLKLGFKLGIGGLILNSDANKLHKAVQSLPISSFVVETDSPSMLPKNSDQSRNTPLLINKIVTKIAVLHAKPAVLVGEQLRSSFFQVVDI